MAEPAALYDVIVESNVMAPMRDGVRLACDIYFPAKNGKKVEGPLPAILERTPYNKLRPDLPPAHRYFAERGFISVIQDCRGRFMSEGEHGSARPEAEDGYDSVEWVAAQSWCNGKVAMVGLSYGGICQGAAGALNPPHLTSMVPACAFSYMHRIRQRFGGAARLSMLIREFRMAVDAHETKDKPALREYFVNAEKNLGEWLRSLPLKRGQNPFSLLPTYEEAIFEIMQKSEFHPDYQHVSFDCTPYWDDYSPAATMLIGGWYDSHSLATVTAFQNLIKRKGSPPTYMLMGPWKHGGANLQVPYAGDADFGPGSYIDYNAFRAEWFDQTLRGAKNTHVWPIKLFVMGGGSGRKTKEGRLDHGGRWQHEWEWPLARAKNTRFYLHAGGGLSAEKPAVAAGTAAPVGAAGAAGAVAPVGAAGAAGAMVPAGAGGDSRRTSYQFDPRDPVPTIGGPVSAAEDVIPGGGFNQVCNHRVFGATDNLPLAARHDVCVFETAPLEKDLEVIGPLEMVLYASSDCVDTDFTAKLLDVYPSNEDYPAGYALNIQDTILRARYRNRREPGELLEPGKIYELHIEFFPTSNLFKKGHTIRLDVSSSNFPRFDVNPNTGEPLMANGLWKVATNTIYHDAEHPSHIVLPLVEGRVD